MLKREDIEEGDLLCGSHPTLHPLLNKLYLVIQPNGLGCDSIQVIEMTTGRKHHCAIRWFKKPDIFCP